jgi:cellulose synthase/poly-beta-1,6-N-acetylglucosamine synthase-like glycosyltransferase
MLPNFADSRVGCVAGKLIYVDEDDSSVGKGAKNYWSYETFVKKAESRACSLIGASGCLYAVRKSAYKPMYAEACSDFLICTILYKQNLRSVFEPDAVCTEETNRHINNELPMRVRIISQTLLDLWRYREMLNPFKYGFFSIELVSHKIFRYSVPVFLFLILISSMLLAVSSKFFAVLLALQIAFYAAAFLGWLLVRNGKNVSVLAFPLYFILANLASVIAFYKLLRGERFARWEPVREAGDKNSKAYGQTI